MAAEEAKPKVDNPDRLRLEGLRQALVNERTDFVLAFELAEKDIDKGDATAALAWVGDTAERWHGEVAGHRTKVRERIDAVLEDLRRRINSMPAQVTPEEASAMSRNRRML
ncbi:MULTISPECIES: hypothetical protein [Streptomyces]|uniref:Terminase small subunit n=1 Tax=Streptomyces evansiae TaxID=3075535 RepID=A0ABU2R9L8_9ACTN|nr:MULTISPECIES: hypothetical protein [unclassified Streptomyces]EFL01523.1 conserved hypothetical protein [Streptomyces sp. SPB78]MDT0412951.1 hypothetical protein [Streptomyces sp. DSM 41979]MYQ57410.1 hypothetical protein [Streptomyces sp. SID4926]SCE59831.1 hypothetical protein GA0115252_17733 [Streptomyces sp. DfronAA-171]